LKRVIEPDGVSKSTPYYSQLVVASPHELIFLSAQTALDEDRNVVGVGDFAAQMRRVLENIRSILSSAGATMADVLSITVYVKDMTAYMRNARPILTEYFPKEPPASTLVEIKGLARPEMLVSVAAIAAVRKE